MFGKTDNFFWPWFEKIGNVVKLRVYRDSHEKRATV
jgi:hypothetical protein